MMISSKPYSIGNAQTIGAYEVESNYFSTVFNEAGNLFAVLADGSIDHPNGRKGAVLAVNFCTSSFLQDIEKVNTSGQMLETAIKANKYIEDYIYTDKKPCISLTMVLLTDNSIQYFNVGDNKIYFYDGHNEKTMGINSTRSFSGGKCQLPSKSAIGVFSAGVHKVTHPIERINIIGSKENAFDKAQAIIKRVKSKRLKNQINATALLIEVGE